MSLTETIASTDKTGLALEAVMPHKDSQDNDNTPNRVPMDPYPDLRSLTQAIRRGDDAAFSRFYDLYSFRIYKRLLLMTRGDEATAREICQVVVIKMARRCEVFHDEAALWAWLCRVARNEFIDNLRSCKRRSADVPIDLHMPELPDEAAYESALLEPLRNAMEALIPADRELLRSFYVDERSTKQLAAEMGQTPKAIESRLGRLRDKVKKSLLKILHDES
jgi:RNA polymerase sigma-70 factor (ECF subfamily)